MLRVYTRIHSPSQPARLLEALYILSSSNFSCKSLWFYMKVLCEWCWAGYCSWHTHVTTHQHGNLEHQTRRLVPSSNISQTGRPAHGHVGFLICCTDFLRTGRSAVTGSLSPLSGQSVSSQPPTAHTIRTLLSRSHSCTLLLWFYSYALPSFTVFSTYFG